jgi:hypothetical protein
MVMAVMGDDGEYILGYCIPFSKLHKYVSTCGIILPQKALQALQIACNTRPLQWFTPLKYVTASTLGVYRYMENSYSKSRKTPQVR